MKTMLTIFGTVGAMYCAYWAVRIAATVVDVLNRWRTGNWD